MLIAKRGKLKQYILFFFHYGYYNSYHNLLSYQYIFFTSTQGQKQIKRVEKIGLEKGHFRIEKCLDTLEGCSRVCHCGGCENEKMLVNSCMGDLDSMGMC